MQYTGCIVDDILCSSSFFPSPVFCTLVNTPPETHDLLTELIGREVVTLEEVLVELRTHALKGLPLPLIPLLRFLKKANVDLPQRARLLNLALEGVSATQTVHISGHGSRRVKSNTPATTNYTHLINYLMGRFHLVPPHD